MIQLAIKNLNDYNQDYGQIEYPDQLFLLRCKSNALQVAYNIDYAIRNRSFSHTKDRGEVQGTTKKMYRQKGTGGARHGTMRASQFRGGGITFGPKFALKKIKINKNLKSLAVLTVFNKHIARGSVFVVADLLQSSFKTKELNVKIKNFFLSSCVKEEKLTDHLNSNTLNDLLKKSGALFIDSFDYENEIDEKKCANFLLASRNIIGVKALKVDSLNIYDLMTHGIVYITQDALSKMIEKFQTKLLKNKNLKVINGHQ